MTSLQNDYPFLVPMEFSDATARRLSWKNQYLSASGALCLSRFTTKADIEAFAQDIPCAIRLTPFHDEFKSKMFAALGNTAIQDSESFGVFFKYNAFTGAVGTQLEVRSQAIKLGSGRVFTESDAIEKEMNISADEKTALMATLEKFAKLNLAPQLHDSLAPFFPEKFTLWKERASTLAIRNPDMIPYPALCPAAIPLTLERENNETFYLVDHYALDEKQTQAILLIFKEDDESEQDVLWGGFRYCLETQKIKTLPDMPGKYNAAQWLKEFDNTNPFSFDVLLPARRELFSKHISQLVKPSLRNKGP